MALRNWLAGLAATATPATSATADPGSSPTVASVATVAVATSANDDAPRVLATLAQATELRALLTVIAAKWNDAERAEALAVALADAEAALTSFRLLAADIPPVPRPRESGPYTSARLSDRDPSDDRRACTDCANLSPSKRCLAAMRGERVGNAGREYHPVHNLLKRCERYQPLPHEADQRTGVERWPSLFADTAQPKAAHGD